MAKLTNLFESNVDIQRIKFGNKQTRELVSMLDRFFTSSINIPRIKVGKKQSVETLIHEEASVFAMYLRDEKEIWIPRKILLNFYSKKW